MPDLTVLQSLTLIAALYVLLESLDAICHMPKGWVRCFCSKVKYTLALICGLGAIYCTLSGTLGRDLQYLVACNIAALAWFVWPRMVFRLNRFFRTEGSCTE